MLTQHAARKNPLTQNLKSILGNFAPCFVSNASRIPNGSVWQMTT